MSTKMQRTKNIDININFQKNYKNKKFKNIFHFLKPVKMAAGIFMNFFNNIMLIHSFKWILNLYIYEWIKFNTITYKS